MAKSDVTAHRRRFANLHEAGTFIVPNVWDVGSARLFQHIGFDAVATTSSGFAATLGLPDQSVGLDDLVFFVERLTERLDVPVSVDSESGYSATVDGLDATVARLEAAGASGISIEDYIPGRGVLGLAEAVERTGRFVAAARGSGMVVTARAENHIYGLDDLDDTITRLRSYVEVGADCAHAPGLRSIADIEAVVSSVPAPINALLFPDGPGPGELAGIGVRRLSAGGSLAFAAYGAAARGARELLERGTMGYAEGVLSPEDRKGSFDG
jgi:2-methylisocitrate lyase-like PEP mutase family enzyme